MDSRKDNWNALKQLARELVPRRTPLASAHGPFNLLPNELVHKIAKSIKSVADLHSLALTSWRLNAIASEYLYAQYSFKLSDWPSRVQLDKSGRDPSLFIRALLEKPGLTRFVKIVHIDLADSWLDRTRWRISEEMPPTKKWWRSGVRQLLDTPVAGQCISRASPQFGRPEESLEDRMELILLLLPKIEKLTIMLWFVRNRSPGQAVGQRIFDLLASSSSAQEHIGLHGFKHLTELKIQFTAPAPELNDRDQLAMEAKISTILRLPTLKNLYLKNLKITNVLSIGECPRRASKVRCLQMHGVALHATVWKAFFNCFRSLEELEIVLPRGGLKHLLVSLEVQKDSLASLQLSGSQKIRKPQESSRHTFGAFHKIAELRIWLSMVWLDEDEYEGLPAPLVWDTLKHVLPPNLQTLIIYNNFRTNTTYTLTDQVPTTKQWGELIKKEEYPHLSEVFFMNEVNFGERDAYPMRSQPCFSWCPGRQ
ncbi:hypothetical protein P280DRAFT_518548 [Massarina eburnea CBS 473.64]|uniref:F-box domain-containing protein n=1 Tax=Massarina eburnea CBS 473.64 TaxID=1395130 RepID=A0A6A6RY56_9PLEO|nr:hypothetical protein P280DRAFT_518548 [Massarina eburnea CBS 473.64]